MTAATSSDSSPHRADLRPADAELHRKPDRRPILETGDPGAHRWILRAQQLAPARHQLLAILDALGRDHELREVGRRQLLIERQIEARRAGADEIDEVVDFGTLVERCLEALRLAQGRGEGRAFRQPQIDQQLRTIRARKELLWHQTECRQPAARTRSASRRAPGARRSTHQPIQPRRRR